MKTTMCEDGHVDCLNCETCSVGDTKKGNFRYNKARSEHHFTAHSLRWLILKLAKATRRPWAEKRGISDTCGGFAG